MHYCCYLLVGGMFEPLHEGGDSSSMLCVRDAGSLQGQQVVAQGLPIAQGGPLPLPLGGPQPRIRLLGRLVAAAVDEVEVTHTHPGLQPERDCEDTSQRNVFVFLTLFCFWLVMKKQKRARNTKNALFCSFMTNQKLKEYKAA